MRGRIIIFEGPDGVGKSTLAIWAADKLRERGVRVLELASPGKTPNMLGALVYDFHHHPDRYGVPSSCVDPIALQVMHVAAHIEMVRQQIEPALRDGASVVLDRCWWSLLAYGALNEVPTSTLRAMVDLELDVWGSIVPDRLMLVRRARPINRDHQVQFHNTLTTIYDDLFERLRCYGYARIVQNDDFEAGKMRVAGCLMELYGSDVLG